MNRIPFILVALACFLPTSGYAQWRAQIDVGVAGSTLRGDTISDTSVIARLSGGGGLQYTSPTGFIFEPSVQYTVKGAGLDGVIDGIPVRATSELTYLEIPLLLGYRWDASRRVHPKILVGPAFAYQLDAQITYQARSGGIEQQDDDDSVQGKDMGLMVVLASEFTVGGETLVTGLRGVLGLTNIRTENPELYNSTVGLFVGIIF